MRQWLSFQEHSRRGNATWMPIGLAAPGRDDPLGSVHPAAVGRADDRAAWRCVRCTDPPNRNHRIPGSGARFQTERQIALYYDDAAGNKQGSAARGMDDVPVMDDVAVLAVGVRTAAAQRHQRRRAEEAFEPVIVEPQAMTDQARWHRVEHPLEDEAARRGDADDGLLVIRRPACRLQGRALERLHRDLALAALRKALTMRRPAAGLIHRMLIINP
jgi:hypothetical protein